MIYKEFKDKKLSALGFGGMRLPKTGESGKIDKAETAKMIDYAYQKGVNYFDTAFFYHAGESEVVLGQELARYPRDTWYLADKFPGNFIEVIDGRLVMNVESMGMENRTYSSASEIFEHQLKNCGVDYFDFYLIHNVSESTYELYTDETVGIVDYLIGEKKAGRIKHLGMSAHGRYETIDKFLSKYDCIEFVMMQLNYLDWSLQEAGKKYDVITKHGIPVFVMEPLRGGLLAAPGEEAEALLKASRPNDTSVSWALRFLQSLPNVSVVISGMSAMEHVIENVALCGKFDPTPESEITVLRNVVDGMASFVPCTTCRYCCGVCPQKLDIPMLIATYNEASHGVSWYIHDVLDSLADDKKPQACTGCGSCSPLCPQNIDIADIMKNFCSLMEEK